jgi:hypothetical protein
MEKERVRPRAR